MLIYILFVIGFFLLIKGADLLVDGASSVARRMHISSIVVGLTIVAFGTSAPEFVINMVATTNGNTEIAIGNIIWSNIANIFLILGISAIIYPIAAKKQTVHHEIPFSLLAALMLGVLANDYLIDGTTFSGLSRSDGLVLLSFFVIFFYYIWWVSRSNVHHEENNSEQLLSPLKSGMYIVGGLVWLIVGGKWIVDGAVHIATLFKVSQSLIGLTVVAIGTSLPELATSAVAAFKKQTDIAIGNIVWSNIFNIFWILWASAVIRPLPFEASSNADILMAIAASIILLVAMYTWSRHTVDKWQWVLMVAIYGGYLTYLVSQA